MISNEYAMTDLANNIAVNYGVLGVVVVALGYYIVSVEKRHKEERDEWRKTIEKQNDQINKNVQDNTSVLSALKTLLENRR